MATFKDYFFDFDIVEGLPVATAGNAAYRLEFYPQARHKIKMRLNGTPVRDVITHCNWEYFGENVFQRDISKYIKKIERGGLAPICVCGKKMRCEFTENYNINKFKGGYERSDGWWDCPSLSPGKHEIAEDCIYARVSVQGQ